ncbi:MAG: transposase [Candidatus Niyogibacteria bacterium]|nr:transposase [Candidatus Niyogibacteria bacterium]
MRNTDFAVGEHYHIFNRGVDKRDIFSDRYDLERFFESMLAFNSVKPIGSIYENSRDKNKFGNSVPKSDKLVNFVCYCLNPNHYHFILEPLVENGVAKFMHKLGLGYTNYFNEKYKRTGSLFQGKYKAIHIDSNEYLLYLSAYINLNDKIHQLGNRVPKLIRSSWEEYSEDGAGERADDLCEKGLNGKNGRMKFTFHPLFS